MKKRFQPSMRKQPAAVELAPRPAPPARQDATLTEEQLEAVAGGKDVKASSSGPDWDH